MMKYLKENARRLADLLPLVAILLCTTIVLLCCTPQKSTFSDDVTELTDGWTAADGTECNLDKLPSGDITISRSLSGIDLHRKRLCCRSTDTHITAIFDGETVYTYAPEQAPILGKSYGMYIHMIPIPADAGIVTLELHPIYGGAASIKDTAVEDAGMFVSDIYHNGLPNFTLCGLIALFGVLMLNIGFTTRRQTKMQNTVNFYSLGAFAILVGLWSANDTLILQVFTQHPEIVRFVTYLCLMFIAFLPVSFIASATNYRKSILVPVLLILTGINFALTMTLSILGISDIRQMLPFSHISIAIAMCMTIYLMVRAVRRKTIDVRFLHTTVIGMIAAVIGAAIDLLRFVIFPDSLFGTSLFTRVGVLIFIVLMGMHLMRERTRLAVEQGRAELMKKMAYTDGLTELANRAAFHDKEDEIRRNHTDCTVVQLDINFLKKVNDVYGHAEGDRHIITAANIIRDSFAAIGTAFRTGGDEFIVIAEKGGIPEVEQALARMEKAAAAYNSEIRPPVPLQIAYGYAHYTTQADMLEAAEKLADERMYEKKRAMKAQS